MRICWSDTETYSETPIRDGTYIYAENAEVMLWAYAFDDGPVKVWDLTTGDPMPEDLAAAIEDPDVTFIFHNSMFDRTVIRYALGIDIPAERIHDTMVMALALSLPGGLSVLCEVLGVPLEESKSLSGRDLIMLFCKPQGKNQKIRRRTRETNPEEWQEFIDYAGSDIKAMRSIYNRLPRWNFSDSELELWRLDQRVNDRGFAVDTVLAEAAIKEITKTQKRLATEVADQTFGFVGSARQRDKLLRFIVEGYGVDLPDMRKATLERRVNDPDLPIEVRNLLSIRMESAKASTAK